MHKLPKHSSHSAPYKPHGVGTRKHFFSSKSKKTKKFIIFDPKKGGVIFSTFLTPPPPHPRKLQKVDGWMDGWMERKHSGGRIPRTCTNVGRRRLASSTQHPAPGLAQQLPNELPNATMTAQMTMAADLTRSKD